MDDIRDSSEKTKCILIVDGKTTCIAPECENHDLMDYVHRFASGSVLLKNCPLCGRIYITKHQLKDYPDEFSIAEDLNLKQAAEVKASFTVMK